jgi:DNA invertase Pin-like site-specific DNA recombinase
MWQMIGVIAELERSLISERTRAGVKAAQRRGVKLIGSGEGRQYVADLLNVGRSTLCRPVAG